jgi:two-component system, NarL family, nitrate/nitrite response regulator NarL
VKDAIRVGLVDDHPLYRTGVVQALHKTRNIRIVTEGGKLQDAIAMAADPALDILLLEIGVAGQGIETARAVSQFGPHAKLVILTASDNEDLLVQALKAGAQGFILKDVTGAELASAIEAVHRGQPYISPALASRLVSRIATAANGSMALAAEQTPSRVDLTSREREVLDCLSQGLTNREIALHLGISIKTIKQHTMLLFSKLKVRNRVEAIIALRKSDLSRTFAPVRGAAAQH